MMNDADAPMGVEDDAALFAEMTGKASVEPAETPANEPAQAQPAPMAEQPAQTDPTTREAERPPHTVPYGELKSEREKRQQYERELVEARGRMQAMEQMFQRQQQPQQPELPPPDIFQDPDAFIQARMQQAIAPRDQALMYNARLIAEARFGEKETTEAIEAFDSLLTQNRLHPAEAQRVMSSPNPFAEAVKWHKNHKIVSEIGDPAAYREKVLSEAMNDPAFLQKALDAARAKAQQPAANVARPAPNVNLPPSLSRVGSAALPTQQTEDDDSLWREVNSKRR